MSKKFWIMSGAYKNAGDFLICNRAICLLREVYPDCCLTIWKRNQPIDNVLQNINRCDAMIFTGGPLYTKDIYPNTMPLIDNINKIEIKMSEIGLGWWGKETNLKAIYEYEFESQMLSLLQRFERDNGELSARDYISTIVLRNNGIKNTIVTGCPAWYSTKKKIKEMVTNCKEVRKICVSDPAYYKNHSQVIELVAYLKKKFPNARICFVWHRGIKADLYTREVVGEKNLELYQKLKDLGDIEMYDISYSDDGFCQYDDCDFHIGYRVHAHIYNLSITQPSILIAEDSRGIAINQIMGLPELTAQIDAFQSAFNPFLLDLIDQQIESMIYDNYLLYDTVYQRIRIYKENMLKHIRKIGN